MPMLTLGQAARLTGLGKTTLTRAIKAGRLSATRRDDGSYGIDPAELHRVYEIRPETPETVSQSGATVHHATPGATPRDGASDSEVTARLATLEEQVKGLRELLDEVRASRDQWRGQAERLALAPPTPVTVTMPERQPWWRRLVG
jgi:excisionase family DNA binding protein